MDLYELTDAFFLPPDKIKIRLAGRRTDYSAKYCKFSAAGVIGKCASAHGK
jgi:hypothetical protein